MRRWSVPTWILVATGLLLNIVSALMTNFYIDGATVDANQLVQQQNNNEKLISLTWQQIEGIERKRELVLNLVSLSELSGAPLPAPVQQEIQDQLAPLHNATFAGLATGKLTGLMAAFNTEQELLREKINQLFIDNLSLADKHTRLMAHISGLRNLALFLQIIGLALILARDLSRRQDLSR